MLSPVAWQLVVEMARCGEQISTTEAVFCTVRTEFAVLSAYLIVEPRRLYVGSFRSSHYYCYYHHLDSVSIELRLLRMQEPDKRDVG